VQFISGFSMTNKLVLSNADVTAMAQTLFEKIKKFDNATMFGTIYGIPRGGIPVAYLLCRHGYFATTDDPSKADIFIDDIIDSGATKARYAELYPDVPFYALIDKTEGGFKDQWVVFPWENSVDKDDSATDNITRILQYVGEDPMREGLLETPARVMKAWSHWTSGYKVDIPKLLKVFEDGGEKYDEMVMVRNIPIYSKCEHHLADIFGTATIAYIPNGRIVGLSKLSRVADAFARRLQVQERLTTQIADALNDNLKPKGVGVIINARHACMESRGICQQGHHTVTSALRGVLKTDAAARSEFMMLANAPVK
jgi:GTP cyclohydrolase I